MIVSILKFFYVNFVSKLINFINLKSKTIFIIDLYSKNQKLFSVFKQTSQSNYKKIQINRNKLQLSRNASYVNLNDIKNISKFLIKNKKKN